MGGKKPLLLYVPTGNSLFDASSLRALTVELAEEPMGARSTLVTHAATLGKCTGLGLCGWILGQTLGPVAAESGARPLSLVATEGSGSSDFGGCLPRPHSPRYPPAPSPKVDLTELLAPPTPGAHELPPFTPRRGKRPSQCRCYAAGWPACFLP